jgi:hypothetical protein
MNPLIKQGVYGEFETIYNKKIIGEVLGFCWKLIKIKSTEGGTSMYRNFEITSFSEKKKIL